MISFKSFINVIHNAIIGASETLMDKNLDVLDKYFDKTTEQTTDAEGKIIEKDNYLPKTVTLNYPQQNEHKDESDPNVSDYSVKVLPIEVPLITLVPLTLSHVEKATLTAEFDMEVVDGELQLHFTNRGNDPLFKKKPKTTRGSLEITLSPKDTPEGIKLLVEGYEAYLKRQIL